MLMMPFTLLHFVSVVVFVLGERMITKGENTQKYGGSFLSKAINFLWQSGESGYQHVWPVSFSFFLFS